MIEPEHLRNQAAVPQGEEQIRSMADSAPVLIWQTDVTGVTLVNRYYLKFFAQPLERIKGMGWADFLHPDDAAAYVEAYRAAFERQERYEFQCRFLRHDGKYRWLQTVGEPHYATDRTFLGFVGCSVDVSDIKAAEAISQRTAELDAFRLLLTDALRSIADPIEIQATAARILGESLGANRVIYLEVVSNSEEVIVHKNYTDGVAELSGRYRLKDYHRNLTADHQAGRTQIVTDILGSSEYTDAEKARYGAIDIAAHIDVPLIKNNQFVALLAVHQATPRPWTAAEVKQVEETAERTWAAVERARIEAELQKSQAQYRQLFESIDEGYFIADVMFDDQNRPIDILYLEANPAVKRITGLDLAGRSLREIDPNYESHWWETFGRVAQTGIGERQELYAEPLKSWFNFYTFKVVGDDSHRVAAVFQDVTERKNIEQERDRFLAVSSDLQSITGSDGYFRWVSPTFERSLGWTFAEMTARPWTDFVHPDDIPDSVAETDSLFSGNATFAFENRYRHKDGSYRWFLWNAQPYLAEGVIYGAAIDITDRKRAEAAVRESEARFRNMADNAPMMIWVTDTTGYCTYLSRSWYDFTGQTESTGLGFGWLDASHPDDRAASEAIFRAANERQDAFQLEYRLRHQNGHYRTCIDAAKPWFGADGIFKGYIGSVIDIDDRIQAEAALRQSEERYRTLFESIDEGFCVVEVLVDPNNTPVDYRVLEINPVFEQQTGIQQAVGKTARELNLEDHWIEVYGQVAVTGEPIRFESGSEVLGRWFDVYACRTGQPQDRKVAIVFKNISDRKRIEDERKRAEAEREQLLQREQTARATAENANRIKDEFLAVLSHELRSPLNPILGWTRLLQTGKLDATRQREALATIERNAKLQTQLIEDLLDISRIMQGKLSLTVAPVSLTFVVSAAVETVRLAAEAKQIQLQLDLDDTVASIFGDAARLQQVVWNLLTNAIKFTPQGGQVTVELRSIDRFAQIRVTDTGKGISADFLPHVFEYFRQEDGSTTRRFGGLGLGLAIVRQLVELHGGTVRAESQGENQGATFIVQLSTMQQTASLAPEPIQPQTDAGLPLAGIQILLVDDEPDTRELQAFLLEQNGARVTAVASGLEVLQALEQLIPDVIVSDIGMAQMDGYMLLQQIRSRPANQGGTIPAIALTAYAAEIDQQRAIQVGFQRHITKPVEPEELVRAIATLLERI